MIFIGMTKTAVKKYASGIRRDISNDEFNRWITINHNDGSEIFLTNCVYESIKDDDNKNWLIVWTKGHGTLLYDETKLEDWESGKMADSALILPS